jgi:DNA-binding LacI/PurR family transcriptional regulator
MARPTIRDIARRTGVSIAVVSHVVNDHPGHVGADTRRRVQKVISALGYRPLGVAKSLRRRESRAFGLVISDATSALFAPVVRGVEAVTASEGYQVLLVNAETLAAEREALTALTTHPVDGLIFMSTSQQQESRHLADTNGIPVIAINRYGGPSALIRILWDDRAGARAAVQHLLDLGHRRIGLIGGPRGRRSAARRLQGYTAAHRANGLPVDTRLIVGGDYTVEAGLNGVRRLLQLSSPPTAILAANDTMAMGALRGIHAAGLRCPDDVAVVGIGDPPFMAFATPPLTTVALPVEEAGRRAAERLLERIRGGETSSRAELLPCTLIVRESSGAAAENRRDARWCHKVDDV